MVKKSRRFAIKQAELANRKKQRKNPLIQKERELSPATTPSSPGDDSEADEPTSPSYSTVPQTIAEPDGQEAAAPSPTTWRYAYVLTDLRRVGIIATGMFILLGILTIFLR